MAYLQVCFSRYSVLILLFLFYSLSVYSVVVSLRLSRSRALYKGGHLISNRSPPARQNRPYSRYPPSGFDEIKAMSRGTSRGKQVIKIAHTSKYCRVCLFYQNETTIFNKHAKFRVGVSRSSMILLLVERKSTLPHLTKYI